MINFRPDIQRLYCFKLVSKNGSPFKISLYANGTIFAAYMWTIEYDENGDPESGGGKTYPDPWTMENDLINQISKIEKELIQLIVNNNNYKLFRQKLEKLKSFI